MAEVRGRVLVVDDDDIIRGFLSEALRDEGYDARIAANGREAVTVLHHWRPDVVILDLMMPEMDGRAFRAEQRRLPAAADIPIIVLSATRDARAQAEALEAAAVFSKPFDLDDLLGEVHRHIGRNPSRTSAP